MDDSVDLNFLAFLHENKAEGKVSDLGLGREDPMMFHLRECKSVALSQARKTFAEYKKELDHAFSLDLAEARADGGPVVRGRAARVLDEFRRDVKQMTDTITELTEVTQHITARQRALKKRAAISDRGRERLRAAKLRVLEQVSQRTSPAKLPSAVLLLLLQPWSDYLCFTDLRYGEDSEAWRQALAVMDKLIWAVAAKTTVGDQALLEQLRKPLQECIGAGLRTIRYDAGKISELQGALEALFDRAAADLKIDVAEEALVRKLQTQAVRHAHRQAYVPPKNAEEILEREVISRLRRLEFGAEFKFGKRRWRLAWFNAKTAHCMLVDARSGAAKLMPGRELARALLAKQAVLVTGESPRPTSGRGKGERLRRSLKQLRTACWSFF